MPCKQCSDSTPSSTSASALFKMGSRRAAARFALAALCSTLPASARNIWLDAEATAQALAEDAECHDSQCAFNALQMGRSAGSSQVEAEADVGLNFTSDLPTYGYQHWATTTQYGDSSKTACGGLDTSKLVQGTRWHNVASAQSMWHDCKDHANCWCGKPGGGHGTAGMGCLSCAKGRFLRTAYGIKLKALFSLAETDAAEARSDMGDDEAGSPFSSEEVFIVVGDLCPTLGNDDWCPRKAGEKNSYGSFNHFDFSHLPKSIRHIGSQPNFNFVFSPMECPHELARRFSQHSACR